MHNHCQDITNIHKYIFTNKKVVLHQDGRLNRNDSYKKNHIEYIRQCEQNIHQVSS